MFKKNIDIENWIIHESMTHKENIFDRITIDSILKYKPLSAVLVKHDNIFSIFTSV